jgi:CHRD domain
MQYLPKHSAPSPLSALGVFIALLLLGQVALAHQNLHVTLTNAAVNPPNIPAGLSSGTATLVVDDHGFAAIDMDMAIFQIDVTGSQTVDPGDNLIGASVHAAGNVTVGTNAPLVWGLHGNPNNNNAPADLVITPFASTGGAVYARWDIAEGNNTTLAAQFGNVLSGHSYILFRTVRHPGGELRGNIPSQIPGDADINGGVDVADLGILASNWQASGNWLKGDFDNSGFIDVNDLGMLASNWQAGVGPGPAASLEAALASVGLGAFAIPEPQGAILLLTLLLPLRGRGRS